jgi:hypothetical protein
MFTSPRVNDGNIMHYIYILVNTLISFNDYTIRAGHDIIESTREVIDRDHGRIL